METRTVSSVNSTARPAPAARPAAAVRKAQPKKDGAGWKIAIMVGSLAAMIGGWGALAINQAPAAAAPAVPAVQAASVPNTNTQSTTPSQTTRPSSGLRQVTAPVQQPQIITRSRSSR